MFKKYFFKRKLAAKLQDMIWEFTSSALYDEALANDIKKAMKTTEDRIMAIVKEQDGLEAVKDHTAAGREKKKKLKEEVENVRGSMVELSKQYSTIVQNSRTSRARAADLENRKAFMIANF